MSRPTHADVVPKPVRWVGTSKDDLSVFPGDVKRRVGRALWDAQVVDYESWRSSHGSR